MNTRYLIFSFSVLLSFAGCSDILDKRNLEAVADDAVWNDAGYATAYLNKLYIDNLPSWDLGIAGNSDEASGGTDFLMFGEMTTTSYGSGWAYPQIRNINILFEKVGSGSLDEATRNSLKGQAAVLRAWQYFQLVRAYGGIPLILTPQKLTDDLYVQRNKTSECIVQIIKDLDDAIAVLPWQWTGNDAGRITKAAALALKGRVLLYYASHQFNPENQTARWQTAYEANKQAVEQLADNGYGLYGNYADIWFDEMNKEVIFVKRYQEPGIMHNWDAGTRPLSEAQNSSGYNKPTLEMVESYPMNTGVPIAESSDYDPVLFWQNRDPRFKATIAYNSCLWELSGKTGRKQWTYIGSETNAPTPTGFYCRKAINLSYTPYYTTRSSTDWIEIRYAEVLLNYAECAAELGKLEEAYSVLKQIRNRAGIIPGSKEMYGLKEGMSAPEMTAAVLLERKIELAYESKRHWDLRRRKLFDSVLNGKRRHGIQPILLVSTKQFDEIQNQVDFDKDYASYFRDSVVIVDQIRDINFRDNYYFLPLHPTHIERNGNLKQTNGWPDGTFNPLD